MSDSSLQRETVEQLAEEFVERYRRGERPSLSRSFPGGRLLSLGSDTNG